MSQFRFPLAIATACAVVVAGALIVRGLSARAPDFSDYAAGTERKQAFFDYFLPIIEQRNREVAENRRRVLQWRANRDNLGWWSAWQLARLADDYRMDEFDVHSDADWDTLLRRVDTVPPSLALAQAAYESAWGTSRFARRGDNFFGQWCYEAGCGLVPKRRDDAKDHEVAVFDSPQASVESYIRNLNSHSAYQPLRDIRAELRAANEQLTGAALATGLGSYSERGKAYIDALLQMIRGNDLSRYDRQ